jgi:hypothetical protein
MSVVSVSVRGLSGNLDLEVDEGSTIADVKAAAKTLGLDTEGLTIRTGGQTASDDQPVSDGQVLVTSPPAAKHG